MKISKKRLKEIIKEELLKEVKIVKFNSNEMDTLHQSGEIYKDDIVYQFQGKVDEDFGSPSKQLQGFSSKEAKKVVDDGLRMWAKDLRKVQYRVIKDWMSKAKSGVIDYFDIVRGLETGDIARAHPYETKFLHSVLDKDKIMNRFRKYFGGKKGMRKR
tara:strand:- start:410 stop:883 length:474 start_codon:yes stop_codon:yes gene_type:complete